MAPVAKVVGKGGYENPGNGPEQNLPKVDTSIQALLNYTVRLHGVEQRESRSPPTSSAYSSSEKSELTVTKLDGNGTTAQCDVGREGNVKLVIGLSAGLGALLVLLVIGGLLYYARHRSQAVAPAAAAATRTPSATAAIQRVEIIMNPETTNVVSGNEEQA